MKNSVALGCIVFLGSLAHSAIGATSMPAPSFDYCAQQTGQPDPRFPGAVSIQSVCLRNSLDAPDGALTTQESNGFTDRWRIDSRQPTPGISGVETWKLTHLSVWLGSNQVKDSAFGNPNYTADLQVQLDKSGRPTRIYGTLPVNLKVDANF